MSRFKVGDRVRVVGYSDEIIGKEGTVVETVDRFGGLWVKVDDKPKASVAVHDGWALLDTEVEAVKS